MDKTDKTNLQRLCISASGQNSIFSNDKIEKSTYGVLDLQVTHVEIQVDLT